VSKSHDTIVPDSEHTSISGSLVARLPQLPRDLAQLARFDRPIGWWLLFWPCAFGVWLAGAGPQFALIGWLLLGAIAMRGAGCVYNDIIDANLDARVARTAARPIASGRVSKRAAWIWLVALCLVGLLVLIQLRIEAQLIALASLVLVAAYPFMKRVTWWPQAWLGMVFTWGLWVGWSALRFDNWDAVAALYAGSICWVIGYDTIYALQDREDDALVGIRSSALRMGPRVQAGIAAFYLMAIALWALAFWLYRPGILPLLTLAPVTLQLVWQIATLDSNDPANPLERFRSNRIAGALMSAACFTVGNA
jgi:4-hydroxybenzoate polyprenyltransferase